jgi:hypothetical protein
MLYTGDRFPGWKGNLIVAGHCAMLIQRVRMEGRGTNERESIVTPVVRRRFRDVRQGPDGLLYLVGSDKSDKSRTPAWSCESNPRISCGRRRRGRGPASRTSGCARRS